jgi:FkbM family methyltransferase
MKDFGQIFTNSVKKIVKGVCRKSFAQGGEDLIVLDILDKLKISKPYYVDLGAYDPKYLSNTYLLYKKGGSGLCVDANPMSCKKIKRIRPRDEVLNLGVVGKNYKKKTLDFFLMHPPKLSSFSKSLVDRYDHKGARLVEKKEVEIKKVNEILKQAKKKIDFLSIDIDGLDLEVLSKIDFKKFRPKIICVESSVTGTGDLLDCISKKGYFLCAKTVLNIIFVDKKYAKKFTEGMFQNS